MVTEDAFPALSDACSCGSWSRQGAETTRDRDWFASWCPRCVLNDCAFLRGGLSRSAAGKTAISAASGWPRPHAPLARTSLVARTDAPRRAILRHGDLGGGLGPRLPPRGPRPRPPD